MDVADHIAELDRQGAALAAAADRTGLAAPVPTCPGWTVRDLLSHIGGVHRWATSHVRDGRAADPGAALATPPTDGLVDWFVAGHAALVAALRTAPADLDCWSFLAAPSPLAFWARRQAHETAIHRADAESADTQIPEYDPAFAADGIDELLNGFFARPRGKLVADPPRTLLVAPTDADRGWHITIGPDSRQVGPDTTLPADCALRGRSTDLYLLLWNRTPAEQPQVTGDQAVLDLWRDRAHVRWA